MSPFSLLILLSTIIFAVEFFIETVVTLFFPFLNGWHEAFVDSALLIIILFPVLYFLILKRAKLHVDEVSKANTELKTQIAERKRTEKALRESENELRYLSSQLLTTQERERRRIRRELHDELMQALAVLKLRLRPIEGSLKDDQIPVMLECEHLSQYIDGIIENVRRLTRDLSPSVLEDLGLTASIQWLADNLEKNYKIKTVTDIPPINHLFQQDSQIMIYRIFQEVLTNVGKHAQATRLSVAVKCFDGSVSFSLEDNGKGFDLSQVVAKSASERGLGLVTIDERVRILGGSLDIRSQEGKGTCLSFSIPVKEDTSV